MDRYKFCDRDRYRDRDYEEFGYGDGGVRMLFGIEVNVSDCCVKYMIIGN